MSSFDTDYTDLEAIIASAEGCRRQFVDAGPLLAGGAPAVIDATLPVITNVTPAEGVERDPLTGTVGFDFTDAAGNLTIDRVLVLAYYRDLRMFEVVYCGVAVGDLPAGFGPQYVGAVAAITNGFRLSDVIRRGGWPADLKLLPWGTDVAGNENA